MQITITRRTAAAVAAVLTLVVAGGAIAVADAATGSNRAAATGTCGPGPGGPRGGFLDAAATYLGVTQAELRTAHRNGTTLAQLAEQKGKTVAGLKGAIYDAAKADLDAAVAAGRLTADQEAAMLSDLQSHLDDIVNGTGPPRVGPPSTA